MNDLNRQMADDLAAIRAITNDLRREHRRLEQQTPQAVDIEIVEKVTTPDPNGIVVPNEIRINGAPVLMPADHPVVVHEVEIKGRDVVLVTLTLIARRVTIGEEVA